MARFGTGRGGMPAWPRALAGVLVALMATCMLPAQAARFDDVRLTDALPLADGSELTMDLVAPDTPGPHPVLLVVADPDNANAAAMRGLRERPGWLRAMVVPRRAASAPDVAATLTFIDRQIGAWGGDADRIVVSTTDARLPDLVEALAGNAARPVGVVVQVAGDADGAAADIAPVAGWAAPLLVLFDPRHAAARRDALRIAANWRQAGARADVLPAPAGTQDAFADALDRWASALAVPRLARWETLVPLAEYMGPPRSAGLPIAIVAHAGRLHMAVQDRGIALWERAGEGTWRPVHTWPEAESLAWIGTAALATDTLLAVVVEAGIPGLWMRDADGGWTMVASAALGAAREVVSRVVAAPERAAVLWLVDDGAGGTAVFDLASVQGASVRVMSTTGLAGRLVDATVVEGSVAAATRVGDTVTLWRHEASSARWHARAELDADTRTLAAVDGGAGLLAIGTTRIERLAATAATPTVELDLADAFAALLEAPATSVIRAVAPRAVPLVHPETGETALVIGIDVADPDARAPSARYLVRDATGRYAIGEASPAVHARGDWPQAFVADPVADGIVHALPASGAGLWSARLDAVGPRRGLWREAGGEGWLALERIGDRWIAAVVLPKMDGGQEARVATGVMGSTFAADLSGAIDLAEESGAEPLDIAFDSEARAACAAAGHADAMARASLGAGDAVRHHCFRRPAGSALPVGVNGLWGGGEGADRWLAFVDASQQRDGVAAEVLLLVRDREGGVRVVRAAGGGLPGYLDLPLYADCPGCGPSPIGNLQLVVDGSCGADAAGAGFVLLLPDGAGFRQRPFGAIERMAGPACY